MEAYVAQATDVVHGQMLLLVGIAAGLGLGAGGVPGLATIATAATVVTAPLNFLSYAVALQVPVSSMIGVYAAWLHSEHLDWHTIWLLLPLSFVGMVIGQQIDEQMTDADARIAVGIILLSILALRVWEDVAVALCPVWMDDWQAPNREKSLDVESCPDNETAATSDSHGEETPLAAPPQAKASNASKFGWACIVGLIGGMATMLTNSMGPILNVYLLSVRGLSPSSYIGTRAMFFCFINMVKLPMRFASGTLGMSMMPLAAVLGLVSVIGVYCARPIMLSMSETTFVRLELAVVAFAGVRLLWMGLQANY